jgi:c-di-GMP-binding flagellar brake protein YcgR
MIENRRFHRVRCTANSALAHDGMTYRGQLENISLSGALVSFGEGIIIPQGGECILTVYLEGEDIPLRFMVEVMHSSFTMAGIKFVSFDTDMKMRLYKLMESVTSEPGKLRDELQLLTTSP